MLRYRVHRTVGDRGRRAAPILLVHGYEFRDAGAAYLPAAPRLEDLAALVAFRTPSAGTGWSVRIASGERIEVSGKPEPTQRDTESGETRFRATWRVDGAGMTARMCRATVITSAGGVVSRAVVSLGPASGTGDPATSQEETWELELADRRSCRPAEFGGQVNAAIDRGRAWLSLRQKEDGSFGPYSFHRVGDMSAGQAALCAYTLLASGASPGDARIRKALSWIESRDIRTTYELSISLMLLERAEGVVAVRGKPLPGASSSSALARTLHDRLISLQSASGGWGYGGASPDASYTDLSNTQMALLGLRAGVRMGFLVPAKVWSGVRTYVESHATREPPEVKVALVRGRTGGAAGKGATREAARAFVPAGYSYFQPDPVRSGSDWRPTGSMTSAAISSMIVLRDFGGGGPDRASIDASIQSAWSWMDRHWTVDRCAFLGDEGPGWTLYSLWSLERAADLDDVRTVGGKDWYFDGAVEILERQRADGSWAAGFSEESSTCFALLFLARSAASTTGR
ncbi:MAG: hypothetical protein HMLKMBBP_00843 [Planctomycetes bacterium]|nr:hypothetical protein [Planctomycetota bacterium]